MFTVTGDMNAARMRHTAHLLPNGKVLVAAGNCSCYTVVAELYDPATGAWSPGALLDARGFHADVRLADGRVMLTGGFVNPSILRTAILYDPAPGTWSNAADMIVARYEHTATLLANGKVLVAGGNGGGGALASAEIYDPATGLWTVAGSLNRKRARHSATLLPSGKVLVTAGVHDFAPYVIAFAEIYDPAHEQLDQYRIPG